MYIILAKVRCHRKSAIILLPLLKSHWHSRINGGEMLVQNPRRGSYGGQTTDLMAPGPISTQPLPLRCARRGTEVHPNAVQGKVHTKRTRRNPTHSQVAPIAMGAAARHSGAACRCGVPKKAKSMLHESNNPNAPHP